MQNFTLGAEWTELVHGCSQPLGEGHPSLPRALSLLSGAGSLGHHPGGSQSATESCWLPTVPEGHCHLGMATALVGFAFCQRSFELGEEGGFRRGGGEQAPVWP